ncbi:hypothetical protein B0H66DRAFT_538170 [Apodospora peruviana]|uniref:Uncharacterized protein n=1 Tax=Apodospora peruviana TaxID=516989 RepID=A0AAE0HW80_9PEZI|nr:hypothetical protein B0H66DRAFT_538170 [Apodospora peruviana]
MTNNTTAYILPQWLLLQTPGMQCRSHGVIIAMLAVYNIISVLVSVILATPFFFRQKQLLFGAILGAWDRVVPPNSKESNYHWPPQDNADAEASLPPPKSPPSYLKADRIAFLFSVLGSVVIALAAPFLAGISLTKSRPDANYWTIIQQWATRPRATIFIFLGNMGRVYLSRRKEGGWWDESRAADGHLEAAITALTTDVCVSLLASKFLWDQMSVKDSAPDLFSPGSPCTAYGSGADGMDQGNCPDMQQGAAGLFVTTIVGAVTGLILFVVLFAFPRSKNLFLGACCGAFCAIVSFGLYINSWQLWVGFLNETKEELYCVQSSALVDLVYVTLPFALGLWRLAWARLSFGRKSSSS